MTNPSKPRITCADGFSFSVQASEFHYCQPRITGAPFYTRYEVGFPSAAEPLLLPFKEGSADRAVDSIYPYTPTEVIIEVIKKHGGLKPE